ncbi:MAG: cytochrome b [Rhodobacterales bacterium]|nr:cytochrome b [Rhodobacterales bacterium]
MTRYHPALVILHWLLAVLIIVALIAGKLILDATPNSDPAKLFSLRAHMSIGLAVLVLMVLRVVIRWRSAAPPPADAGHPALNLTARLAHPALYLLIFGMVFSGIAISAAAGLPGIVFGGTGAPLPETFDSYAARGVHGALSGLLIALVALHVAAALWHQFIRRDGLMGRMRPGRR